MQMGMVQQILAPGVKNSKEADFSAEILRIGRNGLERLSGSPEENAVDGPLILQADVGNLFRYGKDDMKILGLEKFRLPVFDPLGAGQRLTFRAVTIRTVVPDALVAAAVTHFDVTAQGG